MLIQPWIVHQVPITARWPEAMWIKSLPNPTRRCGNQTGSNTLTIRPRTPKGVGGNYQEKQPKMCYLTDLRVS